VGETRIATKRREENNTVNLGEESQQIYYYHGDHLGSAQLVTDSEGETYEQLEYTPYGELWVEHEELATGATPFRFTGKERDGETGLYYFGARYLNPQTSMWLSADPAMGEYIPQAPINDEAKKHNQNLPGMGGVYNYVNLHAYHYSFNNPVRYSDPDGTDGEDGIITATLSQGDPKALEKKWYGKIPILSDMLSGGYFFVRNTLGRKGYHDIAYDPIRSEMVMPKEQQMEAFGTFMAVASSGINSVLVKEASKPIIFLSEKLRHVFGNPAHKMGELLKHFGGNQNRALNAINNAAQKFINSGGIENGVFDSVKNPIIVKVGRFVVNVGGKVENGIFKIGTAYIK
jgi:RHS repeat-associated protein